MPIYEYECQKCGTFEVTQRITEKALGKCPTCKSKVKKLISNTSFQLKGTGWYVTDYARKGQNGDAQSSTGAKTTEAKSESKGETKKSDSPASGGDKTPASASSTTSA